MTATPITSNQTSVPATRGQIKQINRVLSDTFVVAQELATTLSKDSMQLLLGKGDLFRQDVLQSIRNHSTLGPVFPIYLDIEVGGKSKDELVAAIKSANIFVSDYSLDIMSKPAWRPGERERVKFARVKISDLGFKKNPTTREIWARIKELGHSFCEPGDGPAIRLALQNQPLGDYFWVAMEQIADSDGSPRVFRVTRSGDGERWLDADWVYPVSRWDLDDEVVFRLRK